VFFQVSAGPTRAIQFPTLQPVRQVHSLVIQYLDEKSFGFDFRDLLKLNFS
jgi:hypothetical protein